MAREQQEREARRDRLDKQLSDVRHEIAELEIKEYEEGSLSEEDADRLDFLRQRDEFLSGQLGILTMADAESGGPQIGLVNGFQTGALASGNALADTLVGIATLGTGDGGRFFGEPDPMTDIGYGGSYVLARGGYEVLGGVAIGAAGKSLQCGRYAAAGTGLVAWDVAGNVSGTVQGGANLYYNGYSHGALVDTTFGALGLAGDAVGWLKTLSNCFAPGTPVATPTGPRAIEDLREGDLVLAFSHETGEWSPRPVTETHRNRYEGAWVTLHTDGGPVTTTAHHPFWVERGHALHERPKCRKLAENEDEGLALRGRWVNSHDLLAGDVLVARDGRRLRLLRAEQEYAEGRTVHNLTVADDHTYAVGPDAVLVHNTTGCAPSGFSNPHFGQQVHQQFEKALIDQTNTAPSDWIIRTGPGQTGIDASYIGLKSVGFKHAELKPRSWAGWNAFRTQAANWFAAGQASPGTVSLCLYNEDGIIGLSHITNW